tara:strand:- start:514 stop:888 length:375 start_codon:yes stop_codon:yes gene_type:complete
LKYKHQYQKVNEKGYLTEADLTNLDKLQKTYLNSSERKGKMQESIGYKLLLGIIMAAITFFGLWTIHVTSLAIVSVTLVVSITSFFVTSALEATYYFLLTLSGAILARKYNKQIHATPNNGEDD